MNITRKSITSAGCGIVLTTGLIVILVLITGPFIHGLPAGIISISAGILTMKHRKFLKFR